MRQLVAALGLAACLACGAQVQDASHEKMPWQSADGPGTPAAVAFLNPAQVTVAANQPAFLELHFRVAGGLHINSHNPHDANLVATQIVAVDTRGLQTKHIEFPQGTEASLPFAPAEKLSVYSGEFVLKAQIVAAAGSHPWQGVLRYQACTLSQCMPPRKLPVTVDVTAK